MMSNRLLLSEWRTVLISQTYYPMMFQYRSGTKPTYGRRIISKYQEQVREFDDQIDGQWYVVREWTEVEI